MPAVNIFTYKDAIDHVVDFLGANVGGEVSRTARRAVMSAYRALTMAHRWTYFYQRGRISSVAKYSTGTISYDHTGGSNERMVTLTGGTWPTWSNYGAIKISDIVHQVASRVSDTIITLSVNSNPGADVAAATTYTLFRDTYVLPGDFLALDSLVNMSNLLYPSHVHPRDWLSQQRLNASPATPRIFTIMGDPNYFGAMAVAFFPPPDAVYQFDFIYQRRPRPLIIDEYKAGTVTASSGATTIAGTGTTWEAKHVGSVIRLSTSTSTAVTGLVGGNPFATERTITAVGSTTSITVDSAWTETYTGTTYSISDPVDIEEGAMLNAFMRMAEKEAAIERNMKDKASMMTIALQALLEAKAADSRTFGRRVAHVGQVVRPRLSWMPAGTDSG